MFQNCWKKERFKFFPYSTIKKLLKTSLFCRCLEIQKISVVLLIRPFPIRPNCGTQIVQFIIKFIYSEKATKFSKIFTLLLSYIVPVISKVKILQTFVAFSEYMNFTHLEYLECITLTAAKSKRKNAFLALPGPWSLYYCLDFRWQISLIIFLHYRKSRS